jgi:amino acid transporter
LTDGDIDAAYDNQGGELARFAFVVAITTVLAFINYTGLEVVGNLSTVICIISMSPFLILMICAIPKLDTDRWFILPQEGVTVEDNAGAGFLAAPVFAGVAWRPFLNSLFWNLVRMT